LLLSLTKDSDLVWSELGKRSNGIGCELSTDHLVTVFDGKAYFFLDRDEDMLLKHANDYK
jgi:hypothetical protein